MPVSAVVDTVIGLSFAFFVLSLAASAVAEWVATVLQKRSKYLLRGLRAMLEGTAEDPDRGTTRFWSAVQAERTITKDALRVLDGTRPSAADGTPLARLLRHPLIAAQAQRRAGGSVTRPPSYLAASTVAAAVLDEFVGDDPSAMLEGRVAANALPEPLSTTLTALARQADGSVTAFASAVESWYDAQMARVSGYYKRWIKRWILVIAAVLVLVMHIDAISMAGTLWRDPEVRQAVAVARLAELLRRPEERPAGLHRLPEHGGGGPALGRPLGRAARGLCVHRPRRVPAAAATRPLHPAGRRRGDRRTPALGARGEPRRTFLVPGAHPAGFAAQHGGQARARILSGCDSVDPVPPLSVLRTTGTPVLALLLLALVWNRELGPVLVAIVAVVLVGAVLVAVHHAEVVAHRVGEPFGSLILAVAVTIIEVGLILSITASGGTADRHARRATPSSPPS